MFISVSLLFVTNELIILTVYALGLGVFVCKDGVYCIRR